MEDNNLEIPEWVAHYIRAVKHVSRTRYFYSTDGYKMYPLSKYKIVRLIQILYIKCFKPH